ncbi:Type I restriction-modification system, restriction subunit R [Dissulfuribacter thermophilus]|uniref:type I site-specific deoxyribonuclease n=1 Tax=Dissulfuribacter thermophilus TaxID=1156395 RepID=A0A1B9F768_9BACT|nr:type I restriction endonuclease [Dissulfuribacter thermophilus]OCC15645.1 Type I restriction-modification system, restriction subunit R [Dissulfuribacter thermophilus]
MREYTESTLVQQTTAEYLEKELGWESVYAYNNEDFGPDSLLGRASDREVVLTRYLRSKLLELNPGLPQSAYDDAIRQITAVTVAQTLLAINREKYTLLRDGVRVTFRNDKGERVTGRLRVFDFDNPENNHFLCVRELWVRGDLYRRRADIEPEDILLSVRASVGRIKNITLDKIVIGRGLSAIRPNRGQQSFLFYSLKNFFSKRHMERGAIFAAITKKDLHDVELLQPPDTLIEMFQEQVGPIDH